MTSEVRDYERLFDEDAESPEFKLEVLSLRLSHTIAEALKARGMAKRDLAAALGVSAPMVSKILSGRSNFTLRTLVWVAEALDYEFDPILKAKEYAVSVNYSRPSLPVTQRILGAGANIASGKVAANDLLLGWDFSMTSVDNDYDLAA